MSVRANARQANARQANARQANARQANAYSDRMHQLTATAVPGHLKLARAPRC